MLSIPLGYREITLKAWTNGKEVVVLEQGDLWIPCEGDPDEHNCDQMGCGALHEHVLARFKLPVEAEQGAT